MLRPAHGRDEALLQHEEDDQDEHDAREDDRKRDTPGRDAGRDERARARCVGSAAEGERRGEDGGRGAGSASRRTGASVRVVLHDEQPGVVAGLAELVDVRIRRPLRSARWMTTTMTVKKSSTAAKEVQKDFRT